MKAVRGPLGISERLAARQSGLSREQLRRIERGDAAVQFFPAWNFCKFTNTDPLWLAFGNGFVGQHGLITFFQQGFLPCANSEVPGDACFFDVMCAAAVNYVLYRRAQFDLWARLDAVFSQLGSAVELRNSRPTKELLAAQIELAMSEREYYSPYMAAAEVSTWKELRSLLKKAVEGRGAKTALARKFGISSQAVSHWLSGASAPPADTALRLRKWLADAGTITNKKKRAGTAVTAPALKNPKGKIKHEKSESDQSKS